METLNGHQFWQVLINRQNLHHVSTQTCQQLMTFVKLGFLCNFIAIFVVTPCFNRHIAYATLSLLVKEKIKFYLTIFFELCYNCIKLSMEDNK